MKKTNEKKQISLKTKIGRYLLFFGLGIISVLFVFQVFLLEPMYESAKVKSIISVADEVVRNLETDDLDSIIESRQLRTDASIGVLFPSSEGLEYEARFSRGLQNRLTPKEILENIARVSSSEDGTYLYIGTKEDFGHFDEKLKSIIYTRIIYGEEGDTVVMVSSTITPLDATVTTLQRQLLYIGMIIAVAVIILTYLMYNQIAKPLAAINEAAKQLPSGSYEADERTNRYREAAELNETLTAAAQDIQKADKAKRDLIANVSHDLRTPLTMITGYGEMMQDLPEEKTDENLQVIVDESKRLNALVNDLLDLSKLQEGKITINPEEIDLSDLIRTQMRKYDVYRMQEGFEIEESIEDGLTASADRKRLEQVFNNFMTNAINYSGEKKHIIVKAYAEGNNAKVEVRDFGAGIEKKDLPNIWDRYYKVDKEHVRVSSGSGIGLSIAKEILDLHHAKYGVISAPQEGSTFWFSLPLLNQSRA